MIHSIKFDEAYIASKLLGGPAYVVVDNLLLNANDLSILRPGGIIRAYGRPNECIAVAAVPHDETLGCVAGWISEGE